MLDRSKQDFFFDHCHFASRKKTDVDWPLQKLKLKIHFCFFLVLFFKENFSPIFSNKAKTTGDDGHTTKRAQKDIIEHDVTGLSKMNHLPKPDAFEALQIGSDR